MNWFAIKTRPKCELKARDFFSSFNIESYAPYYKTKRVWSDRIKKVKVSALPGYVFFRTSKLNYSLINLNPYTKNIVRNTSGGPAVITNNEISVLKNHFNGDLNIHKLSFKIGEKVKVNSGPMIFKNGVIEKVTNKNVTLILKSLNVKFVLSKNNLVAA